MPRPRIWIGLGALALLGWGGTVLRGQAAKPQPAAPPNVLLVTVDTLRPDALGWVAGRNETPHFDALARAGFRFPAAVSPVPLTLPAHTSIFSGLVPRRHGVRDNGQIVPGGLSLLTAALKRRGYATGAFVSGYPLRSAFGLDQGFDHYDDQLPEGQEGWLERPAPETTKAALAWLGRQKGPWLAWIHYYDPHDPYTPPRAFWKPGPRGAYDGEVAFTDDAFGDLRRGVERLGGTTLTVMTADHGESLGEHGEGSHGFFIYDSTVLVPLVFHLPGRIPARASRAPVRLVDVAPTILDLLRLPPFPGIDGVSLTPWFAGKTPALPPAYVESQQPWITYGWAPLAAVRTGGWKLIAAPKPELYDLTSDPGERTNRIDQDRRRARELQVHLREVESRPEASATAVDDPQTLAALRSLGYLGGGRKPSRPPAGLPDPKDRLAVRDLLATGEALLRQGDFRGALARFDAVLKDDPNNRFATLRSGMALLKAGDAKGAVPRLEKAVAIDPEQAENRYALADALTRAGDLARATDQWMETIRLQPRRAAAWSNLGTVLARRGQIARAAEAYEKALAIEPANGQLKENLGAARYQWAVNEAAAGRKDAARRILAEALKVAPGLRARAAADARLAPLLP